MAMVSEVIKAVKKHHGATTINTGVILQNAERIPTGVLPFDLAVGGGIPLGRISILYGPESSLKTTMALKAVANYQRMYPKKVCVFVDVENHYDPLWGEILGVNNKKLVYVLPDYAEQSVDIVQDLLDAKDIGMIVYDSIAAMITSNESTSSADKMVVGGAGLVVGRLYRKVSLGLLKARREGRHPAFIAINQTRFKVGVMFGDPETMPGGQAFKFASSLTVRLYGKEETVKKVNPVMPAYKLVSGIVKKYKVPIVAKTFEFKMGALDSPANGIVLGQVNDWNTMYTYLQEMGWAVKRGRKVKFLGDLYESSESLRAAIYEDESYLLSLKKDLIVAVMEKMGGAKDVEVVMDSAEDEVEDSVDSEEEEAYDPEDSEID